MTTVKCIIFVISNYRSLLIMSMTGNSPN